MLPSPANLIVTVDVVLLTLQDNRLHVALTRRENEPFQGHWALPGGFIHPQEDDSAKAAAARVLREKTAIASPYLEEFGTFSGPVRDPRGWSLTVVHYALVARQVLSERVALYPVETLPDLPFQHRHMIESVVQRVRSKSSYSSLPVYLCPEEFTIPELHRVYESVLGEKLGMANFRRKLDDLGMLEVVQRTDKPNGRHRPAQLYRLPTHLRGSLAVRERGI